MSDHEIEDLVEESIRLLDASFLHRDDRLRDWFAALFRFQREFDCSFMHFRVMDILMRRRFTYRFSLDQHPDYAERRPYFEALDSFVFLSGEERDLAGEDYDDMENPGEDQGYVEPPYLFCDAGSSLWRRMVEAGHLTGQDAVQPRPVSLDEVVSTVTQAAERGDGHELIAMWEDLVPWGPHWDKCV